MYVATRLNFSWPLSEAASPGSGSRSSHFGMNWELVCDMRQNLIKSRCSDPTLHEE